jgi:hypothetical protein
MFSTLKAKISMCESTPNPPEHSGTLQITKNVVQILHS